MKPKAIVVTINSHDYVVDSITNQMFGTSFNWRLTPIYDSNFFLNYDPMFLQDSQLKKIKKAINQKVLSLYKSDDTFKFYVLDERGILHE